MFGVLFREYDGVAFEESMAQLHGTEAFYSRKLAFLQPDGRFSLFKTELDCSMTGYTFFER